ncbi:MAG TPA: sulfide/dihydroorotate dehydrogenase-like FAD/NAD-binding protein [Tissierellales bacterium]|nr:sulfide/dihydroorotate dehydrogenase-like FAD/NAD-binding protein [Tissierellales bacterium]
MVKYWKCVDAGSEYCPCYLAETKNCISCSQLRGEEFCDCQWNGVCILNEYINNLEKVSLSRKNYKGKIIDKKILENGVVIIKIKTEKDLVKNLMEPGSYVFIKGIKDEDYFKTPMSIFKIDSEANIYIVYQELGCKTKSLRDKYEINIRGPYWHGILGSRNLKNITNSKSLVIARGIGQSSILLATEKLISNNNKVYIILDKGKLNSLYFYDFFDDMDKVIIKELDLFTKEGSTFLESILKKEKFSLVLSGGSNMLHRRISSKISLLDEKPYFLTSNNGILCCGEGVCGSCMVKTIDGTKTKLCKSLVAPNKLY